jgi:DMSO/TMAO reductase YedYZ molybdopterin-dependent catalytic subunit
MTLSEKKDKVPPNQRVAYEEFPVLHVGSVPKFNPEKWDFTVEGLINNPLRLSYSEFLKLPSVVSVSDFHCVTGWSVPDSKWEGVAFKTIFDLVQPEENAHYVTVIDESDYTTSLPIEDLMHRDVLLAHKLNDKPLEPARGAPLRLVVPHKYAYKSAKWVRKLRFTEKQELGFWEKRGYSNSADPWKEERYT